MAGLHAAPQKAYFKRALSAESAPSPRLSFPLLSSFPPPHLRLLLLLSALLLNALFQNSLSGGLGLTSGLSAQIAKEMMALPATGGD